MGHRHSKPSTRSSRDMPSGTKRALLVGCNYPNTKAELAGCSNDVQNWNELLTTHFGFEAENVRILTEQQQEDDQPTGKNIKEELTRIVRVSRPGDIVFFHFSGHGVQVPADEDGDYEEDGLDEALCPSDLNLIIDDDLRDILAELDPQVKFTMVSDCCHSGGMLDHNEIAISGTSDRTSGIRARIKNRGIKVEELENEMKEMQSSLEKRNRAIDVSTLREMLQNSSKSMMNGTEKLRSILYDAYGKDASHAAIATQRDLTPEEQKHIHYTGPGKKPDTGFVDPNKGILITGCQSHETSADVTGADGRAFGALTHAVVKIVGRHKSKYGDRPISNQALVLKVRQLLDKSGFEQNPCLECSSKNASSNFIEW